MPVIMINMPVSGLSRYMAAMLWGRVGGGAGTSPRRAGDRRRNSAADLRDIPGLRSIQLFGTKAANVALLAQRLGVPARLFGRTGDDALREQALAPLRDAGLDLAGVSIAAGCATAVAMMPFCPTGKRASTVSKNAVVAAAKPGCLCAQQHDVPIPQTAPESQAMMRHLVFCHECASIGEAAAFMARARVRRLPVVARDRELVGIVSLADMPVSLMPAGTLRPL